MADGVVSFLIGAVRFSQAVEFPGNEGFAIAAVVEPRPDLMISVQDCLVRASASVRDRIAFAISQDFADVRILATVDEEFQEGLILARRSPGLQEFLDDLDDWSDKPGRMPADERPTALQAAATIDLDDTTLREAFAFAVERLAPVNVTKRIQQLQVRSHLSLSTPLGRWSGWAEFKYGLANLRYGQAVLAIAMNHVDVHLHLARFFKSGGSSSRNAGLVLVVVPEIFNDVATAVESWSGVMNVSVSRL